MYRSERLPGGPKIIVTPLDWQEKYAAFCVVIGYKLKDRVLMMLICGL